MSIVPKTFPAPKRAFSLVEVTIALGLVSFAVMAIMGLLPTGLSSLRASMNQTVEAQIVKSIGSESAIANFTNLASSDNYFDSEGFATSDPAKAYYTVSVTTNASVFPGSDKGVNLPNSLTSLRIQVVARPSPSAPAKTTLYTLQVANTGK